MCQGGRVGDLDTPYQLLATTDLNTDGLPIRHYHFLKTPLKKP